MTKYRISRTFLFVLLTASLLAVIVGYGKRQVTVHAQSGTLDVPGEAPGIHLVSPLPNGQWTTSEGDLAGTRFSPLNQINTRNVQNLKLIANVATGIPHGHEGNPLVIGSTMYMITPFPNNLMAIDLKIRTDRSSGCFIPPARWALPAAMSLTAAAVMATEKSLMQRSTAMWLP